MSKEEIKVNDKIYYTLKDCSDVIYEGWICGIVNHNAILGNFDINDVFYEISDKINGESRGVALRRDEIYTIKDLFNIKDEYEYLVRRKSEIDEENV